jgi:hypothetical protein
MDERVTQPIEVDVWVREHQHATTHIIANVPADPQQWTDADVQRLLSEMLLTLNRAKNPGGEPPPITLRGFNWIVSFDEKGGGVIVHLEMHIGTASAGPFAIDEQRLVAMIQRVMQPVPSERIH